MQSIVILCVCAEIVGLVRGSVPDAARKISAMSDSPSRLNELSQAGHMSAAPQQHRTPHTPNASHFNVDYVVPLPMSAKPAKPLPPTSATAKPVYTADQYIEYYWQSPPVKSDKQDTDTSSNGVADAAVGMSPGMLMVQRTVFVVIEQMRSMWNYVWSYFGEPAPSMLNAVRSLARVADEEDDDDDDDDDDDSDTEEDEEDGKTRENRHPHDHLYGVTRRKRKHRFRKFLIPLLMAYKLKFFTMIPMFISGLVLLTGSAGMTGFFFALFTAVLSMKHKPS